MSSNNEWLKDEMKNVVVCEMAINFYSKAWIIWLPNSVMDVESIESEQNKKTIF